ncbi:hypothetical protein BFW01_g6630 [Lasiodiplodia theobromae]|uniref:Uncharacterized protein n=2 Tax=Lasiodiplodia TaxID=66739 RepID=A0A5N5DWZ7_9PEZI|nr:uncharacterized protein LTHEOB_6896 [Lasiodiplodia theobromae]KAB2580684.1 hypothetical protein DBV05_g709 [Lasiodiplodia theobromae]KAF4543162.1 hypothetical protein LTHEOB_6896 [Lasiodiplodia theobromae]KAF9635735.1 hypothetical protein BFW01_g6630 [Lasiodiplodia theobromae]KAK0644930.1 hypothetical protein DIS24_g8369 [Lasiodiplodia hormozganensis]
MHSSSAVTPPASTSLNNGVCYFSFVPASRPENSFIDHYSTETPSPALYDLSVQTPSEPSNPLLAARDWPVSFVVSPAAMDASKILQLQTAAAYSYQNRPQPQPVQDVLDLSPISSRSGSDASSASSSRTSVSGESPSVQFIRCSRCHRTDTAGSKNMVGYGINSYYCVRCADIVGYSHNG